MTKQKSRTRRRAPAIDRSANDAGPVGNRIADLMLISLDATADRRRSLKHGSRKAIARQAKKSSKGKAH